MNAPFGIQCKNCGTPVGYDIINQTYRCPSCGLLSGIREVARENVRWRRLQYENRARVQSRQEVLSCPNCGASLLFDETEESVNCDFCGGRLVRQEFELSPDFPDFIIPFVLTAEDAKARLLAWAEKHKDTPEAALIGQHVQRLTGYYLPYKLVRGPVEGRILRQQTWKTFFCRGFMESVTVNTSRQLDNTVLDAADPFDLSALRPFEHGFIAGHKVKLSDLSPAKTARRSVKEAEEAFAPTIARELHTEGIRVHLRPGTLMEVPVLLPVYLIKVRGFMAVVNGQTGRVAVSALQEEPSSRRWMWEPAVLSAAVSVLIGAFYRFNPLLIVMLLAVLTPIFFGLFRLGRRISSHTHIEQGELSRAKREDGTLKVTDTKTMFSNPLPNAPVFCEAIGGQVRPVFVRFFSFGRVLHLLWQFFVILALPFLLAAPLMLALGTPFTGMTLAMGSPWLVLAGFFCIMYWGIGVRKNIYNYPIYYENNGGRKGRVVGDPRDRKISIRRLFGLDERRTDSFTMKDFPALRKLLIILAILLAVMVLLMAVTVGGAAA